MMPQQMSSMGYTPHTVQQQQQGYGSYGYSPVKTEPQVPQYSIKQEHYKSTPQHYNVKREPYSQTTTFPTQSQYNIQPKVERQYSQSYDVKPNMNQYMSQTSNQPSASSSAGGEEFKCPVKKCDKSYAYNSTLLRHIRAKHSIDDIRKSGFKLPI